MNGERRETGALDHNRLGLDQDRAESYVADHPFLRDADQRSCQRSVDAQAFYQQRFLICRKCADKQVVDRPFVLRAFRADQ